METITQNGAAQTAQSESVEVALVSIEHELARQSKEARRFRSTVVFFGVIIALLTVASLVAVAAKLGTKDIKVTAAPAGTAAKTAAPAVSSSQTVVPATAGLPSATSVALKEFKVLPTVTTVASGKIIFKVHNTGTVTHEFVVLKTNHPAAKLPLYKGRADEAGNVGETGDLKAGQSKNIALILPPGHYALICNLPGHYLAGQHVDLTVK